MSFNHINVIMVICQMGDKDDIIIIINKYNFNLTIMLLRLCAVLDEIFSVLLGIFLFPFQVELSLWGGLWRWGWRPLRIITT
jgi:hypothetical protein